MRHCYGCMKEYSEKYEVCPFCGYVVGTKPEVKTHLLPGTKLSDRYIVGKAIGHGGFGITYIAWDEKIRKVVAVKEYFPNAFSTRSVGETQVSCFNSKGKVFLKEGIRKTLDEAKRLSRFSSNENIVDIFDFFEENNTAYIVMEYLEGKDLKKHLEENGDKLAPEKAVEIIIPVLNALEDMHKESLIHRDISPDNIFICDNGKIKLLDFGSARLAVEDSDKSLSVMVKRGYAPREQYASRSKQGPWTDVYSVCATLYRMITGKVPVESTEREDEPLKSFSEYGVTGYGELEKVIFKGLEVEYTNRIRSVAELRTMLTKTTKKNPEPVAEPTEKKPEPAVKSPKVSQKPKNKLNIKAIIAAVAAVAVVVTGIVLAVKFVPSEKPDKAETTTVTTEEVELAVNATQATEIYEEFLLSDNLKSSYPVINAFINKNISLCKTEDLYLFEMESLGIKDLSACTVEKEYLDLDNDGINELLLSLDINGEKTRVSVFLFDIDINKKVFEGASWECLAPSRTYNHLSVMKDEDKKIYFVEFSNEGLYGKDCLKSIYDGKKLCPQISLSFPDYGLLGYSHPDWEKCVAEGKSLYQNGNHGIPTPAEDELEILTYEEICDEWEKIFSGTKIAGYCDSSAEELKTRLKMSDGGDINENITWRLYENGCLIFEGNGAMPSYHEKTTPWYKYSFEMKPFIETVIVGKGITVVGKFSFMDHDAHYASLTKIVLSDTVTMLDDYAFDSCAVQEINIPASVIRIGECALGSFYNMEHISVDENNVSYSTDEYGVLFNKDKSILIGFPSGKEMTSYTIPYGVQQINAEAFYGSSLEEIIIPKSVYSIGDGAFSDCRKLKSITFPQSVAGGIELGDYLFWACDNLTSVTLPDGIQTISESMFSCCGNLKSVTVPDSVTSIEKYAFESCENLTDVHYGGSFSDWNNVSIAQSNDCLNAATIHYNS